MKFSEQELQEHLFQWLEDHGVARLNTRQMVAVSESARRIYEAIREHHRPSRPGGGWAQWLTSDDTCSASVYMLQVFRGTARGTPIYPTTEAAFLSCESLLQAEPKFRERLGELAGMSDEWALLVQDWDDILESSDRNGALLQVLGAD